MNVYASALRKVALYQRPTKAERRELRRHRMPDGSYAVPVPADSQRRLAFRLSDPRIRR